MLAYICLIGIKGEGLAVVIVIYVGIIVDVVGRGVIV